MKNKLIDLGLIILILVGGMVASSLIYGEFYKQLLLNVVVSTGLFLLKKDTTIGDIRKQITLILVIFFLAASSFEVAMLVMGYALINYNFIVLFVVSAYVFLRFESFWAAIVSILRKS